jgi:hypothetical protein
VPNPTFEMIAETVSRMRLRFPLRKGLQALEQALHFRPRPRSQCTVVGFGSIRATTNGQLKVSRVKPSMPGWRMSTQT